MSELGKPPIPDDTLHEIVRSGRADREVTADVAHELIRARNRLRGDSRRAEQIRRARWVLENGLVKIEELSKFELSEDRVAEAIARFVESLEDPVDRRALAAAIRSGGWR